MKYVLGTLSVFLLFAVVIMAWNNPSAVIALSVPIIKLTIFTNSFVYVVGVLLLGCLSGLLFGISFVLGQKETISAYKRQLEKLSVVKETNQSRVEVLEAKIKTLEMALQQSLDSN